MPRRVNVLGKFRSAVVESVIIASSEKVPFVLGQRKLERRFVFWDSLSELSLGTRAAGIWNFVVVKLYALVDSFENRIDLNLGRRTNNRLRTIGKLFPFFGFVELSATSVFFFKHHFFLSNSNSYCTLPPLYLSYFI